MFLSWVQVGSYRMRSIWIGSFRIWVYSDRYLSVMVLSGKRNLDSKGIYKFSVRFWVRYFRIGFGSGFRILIKMLRPIAECSTRASRRERVISARKKVDIFIKVICQPFELFL